MKFASYGMYEGYRAAFLAAVDQGLADAEAGPVVPNVKARRWLLSWGTDNELRPPKGP